MIKTALEALMAHLVADAPTVSKVAAYLRHYGYLAGQVLSAAVSPATALAAVVHALRDLQRDAGIPETGVLDVATFDILGKSRCGVLDAQRLAEFARWRKNVLTYYTSDYLPGLSQADQMDLTALAFKQWCNYADVTVSPAASAVKADMIISVGRGSAQGFDGPSGTLAYAYLPDGRDGQLLMRFDLDEQWIRSGSSGIFYLNVACHEFGHLLGLDHSRNPAALMAPYYSPRISEPQPNDDIPRIQALYGPAKAPAPGPAPTPTPTPAPAPGRPKITLELEGRKWGGELAPV